jgi:hypothetical protein
LAGGFYSPNPNDTITAANWKQYVRDQTVNQFPTAAARGSAIVTPSQGMVSYRNDLGSGGGIEQYTGSAWAPAGTQLIGSTTLGVAAGTVTFSSIPAVFGTLLLVGLGSLTGVGTTVNCSMQINSDGATNYSHSSIDTSQAGLNPTGAFQSGQSSALWAFGLPGTTWSANRSGGFSMTIPGYSNTTMRKVGITNMWATDGGTSFEQRLRHWWWNGSPAINTLLLTSGAGNFSVGSYFALYGMP